ncbi:MAG: hypothetical protein AAGD11_08150 [Planctomycetota bacterium]
MTFPRIASAIFLLVCMIAIVGCASDDSIHSGSVDRQTRILMSLLSVFYGEYLDSHRGIPPQDNAVFRAYMQSRSEELQRYNLQSLDQLLTSPRDGKPFEIVCGKRRAPSDSPDTPWAAYEQQGVDGVVMAVLVRGGVRDLSDAEIQQIVDGQ